MLGYYSFLFCAVCVCIKCVCILVNAHNKQLLRQHNKTHWRKRSQWQSIYITFFIFWHTLTYHYYKFHALGGQSSCILLNSTGDICLLIILRYFSNLSKLLHIHTKWIEKLSGGFFNFLLRLFLTILDYQEH